MPCLLWLPVPVSHTARRQLPSCVQTSSQRSRQHRTRVQPSASIPFWQQAWNTGVTVDSQTLAANLFASSIVPYAGFLWHLQRSKQAPKLTMFGFYWLLVFVAVTIPAGIISKVQYNTSLSNVDYLHGSAESMLTLTNLFIVIGLRQGIREAQQQKRAAPAPEEQQHITVKEPAQKS